MVRAGKRDRTSDGRKVDERDAADTPTRPKVARVTRSSSRRSPRLQRNASTSAGSGGASSPPQTPAARKKQDATKPSTKSKSPKAQATKSRKSPKTPKKAAKSPKLKRKPSLKKSTSAAPLPEGWDLVVPRVDASEDAMVDSISETNPGFKAFVKKTTSFLPRYLEKESPHLLCLNETKLTADNCAKFADKFPGYTVHFHNCSVKKGYSGTAVCVRDGVKVVGISDGLGKHLDDNEGRVITVELGKCFVVVAYVPNSGMKLDRLEYRTSTWDVAFRAHLADLRAQKGVVVVGDLNVAYSEQDLAKPKTNRNKTPGFCDEEREGFSNLLADGFVDSWRVGNTQTQCFSYWSYRFSCRQKNLGWRIDYALVSKDLASSVVDAFIRPDLLGSDHVPIGVVVDSSAV